MNARSVTIIRLDVEQQESNYRIVMDVVLSASARAVWRVLTDYGHLKELTPALQESEVMMQLDESTHRVRGVTSFCFPLFCMEVRHVQVMRQQGFGDLIAEIEPAESDFEFGKAHWHLWEESGATHVVLESVLRPAFWMPPIVGPWAIRQALLEQTEVTAMGLQRMARRLGQ